MPDPYAPPPDRAASRPDLWRYQPVAVERWVERAARVERMARAAWRRLSGGQRLWRTEDRRRLTEHRHQRPGEASGAVPSEAEAPVVPLLYLPALPWAGRFQRPQQLAAALTRAGTPVLWIESFLRTRIQPTIWVSAPLPNLRVLRCRLPGRPDPFRQPFPDSAVEPLADAILAGRPEPPQAIVVQLPFWAPLGYELRRRTDKPLIYDRIDLHTEFPGVPPEVGEIEDDLVERSDLVTCTSPFLAALSRRRTEPRRVQRIPNAADPATMAAGLGSRSADRRPQAGGSPIAGFVGALDRRIDGEALAAAARALPNWRFRFAGRVEHRPLAELGQLPNVELLGEIAYERVAGFLATLDVGVIPYRDTPLTRAIDPVKQYEMLVAGLPVVRRQLPGGDEELALAAGSVYLYSDPSELATALGRAHTEDAPEARARRAARAAEESWNRRAEALLAAIDRAALW